MVLQHEVGHVQRSKLPHTAEPNGEIIEEVEGLVHHCLARGPVFQIGDTLHKEGLVEGATEEEELRRGKEKGVVQRQ